ncbi:MAG: TIGR01212 family radical SAM protein [Spirochaetales bacterium]|nr:TIGR01212 family radical SAM protein [Spirochaetales bacterium]
MTEKFYRTLNDYNKEKTGQKVWRLPLDMGLPCPNRLEGRPGCSFCDGLSFLPDYLRDGGLHLYETGSLCSVNELDIQLEKGKAFFGSRLNVSLFWGYFQANTNTYGDMTELLLRYKTVLEKEYIIGIMISTRPDYIYPEILRQLQELTKSSGKEIWLEIGLQSVFDETLEHIHRGHSYRQFCSAVAMIHNYAPDIKIGVHMILGLPGESIDMMIDGNYRLFRENQLDGVKFRMLDFTEGTEITEEYKKYPQRFVRFTDVSYVKLICDIIERLPPHVLIFRFANFKSLICASTDETLYTKGTILRKVEQEFIARNTKQGSFFDR